MSISLDLMELADFTTPKKVVGEILRQNPSMPLPVPLEDIACQAGISEILYNPLDGLEGTLVANPEKSEGVIAVNTKNGRRRQRFTLGHELGHFMLRGHGYDMQCTDKDILARLDEGVLTANKKIEAEANEFSANLLMPEEIFCGHTRKSVEPTLQEIITLKELFDVSLAACANRYVLLSDFPVAIIFSKNKYVKYHIKSPHFPFWIKPHRKALVPYHSLTSKMDIMNFNRFHDDAVDSDIWLSGDKHYEMPEQVIERVYIQQGGYIVTMLSFEDELLELEG